MLVTYLVIKKIIYDVMIVKEVKENNFLFKKRGFCFSFTLFIFNIEQVEFFFLYFITINISIHMKKYFLLKQTNA